MTSLPPFSLLEGRHSCHEVLSGFIAGLVVGLGLGLACVGLVAALMLRRLVKEMLVIATGFLEVAQNFQVLVAELLVEHEEDCQ